jgi:hypothetical protein
VRIINENININLTDLKASLLYLDTNKNKENLPLKNYNNNADPLSPSESQTIIINTSDATEPDKVEIVPENCPKGRTAARFSEFR